jgi:ABC-type lipoprotein export system ATPase subunit
LINLQKVTRRFNLGDNVIEPVSNVSLEVRRGEFIVIIGRSGSGKTTLLNLIAGLIKPSSGNIYIDGINLQTMNDRELSTLRNQKIGFVFQFPSLLPSLMVIDNVTLPDEFFHQIGNEAVLERALQLLNTVGLGHKIEAYPRQLSAGEQKRAVIARALINRPQVLLADEPTSDLDETTEQEIMSLFLDIRSGGVTVLMVTHNLQLLPFATKAFRMDNGHLTEITTDMIAPQRFFDLEG